MLSVSRLSPIYRVSRTRLSFFSALAQNVTVLPTVSPHVESAHGFTKVKDEWISEYKAHAALYRHNGTGAEVMSLCNDDENKVFGIVFKTPPKDSTGVAHVLEHSVLCGSRKYPLKEPFVELLKGSMQTFLNAFTYPDRTCYPVASCNIQDFYNLIDVYLDAVFYPRSPPTRSQRLISSRHTAVRQQHETQSS